MANEEFVRQAYALAEAWALRHLYPEAASSWVSWACWGISTRSCSRTRPSC